MPSQEQMPTFDQLMNPMLKALHDLGGSGSISEISEKVIERLDLPDEIVNVPHDPDKSSQTEVEYRLAWARTYLKKFGIMENSSRGVWVIKPEHMDQVEIDSREVVKAVRAMDRERSGAKTPAEDKEDALVPEEAEPWRAKLHHVLTKKLSPDGFERLTKRLLRESGFVQVEVTGRSGDGGIDGTGIIRLSGILSFHVVFQCKRYSGSVGSREIRDFRGAMIGRADKGLFITTGIFTRDAVQESTRDGAPPIDLVDGEMLADMLKDLKLGISATFVEEISVNEKWFETI